MTPEAEAAHRPDSGEPITPTGRADHDLAWLPGDLTPVAHSHLKRGCSGCAFIAAIEREAAHRDSPLIAALEQIRDEQGKVCSDFEVCVHTSCRSSYTSWAIADAALAAEPIAASSRLDEIAAIAAALNEADNRITETAFEAPSLRQKRMAAALHQLGLRAERLRATPEPSLDLEVPTHDHDSFMHDHGGPRHIHRLAASR